MGAVRPRHVRRRRADAGLAVLPAELARRDRTSITPTTTPRSRREIARISPDDIAGYEDFLEYAEGVWMEGYVKLGHARSSISHRW